MARKKYVEKIKYTCTITDKEYKVTKKAANPEELISVEAYYELNPDKDDRPEAVKKQLGK